MAIIRRVFIQKPRYLEIRMKALAGSMNEGEFHRQSWISKQLG